LTGWRRWPRWERGGVPRRAGHGGGAGLERPCMPVERPMVNKPQPPRWRHQQRQLLVMTEERRHQAAAAADDGAASCHHDRHGGHAMQQDHAQGTRPHQRDAGGAGSPAGSGVGHPARSSGARPPAPALLTPPTSPTASPARPHPSSRPGADRAQGVSVQPEGAPGRAQPAGRTAPAGWCCSDAAGDPNPAGACSCPGERRYQGRQRTRRSNQPGPRKLPVARARSRPGGSPASANHRRSR
jgi:hypothetical protein